VTRKRRLHHPLASVLVFVASFALPWSLRRRWLTFWFGYDLHPTSRLGLSLFMPEHLVMREGARIGHLNVCRRVDRVELGEHIIIGQWNWITGTPLDDPVFYRDSAGRRAEFVMGAHSTITSRHYIDCADRVSIGEYTSIGGVRSVIFTHGADLVNARQAAKPVSIGAYVLVRTGSTLLPGSSIPDKSVIAAGAVVTGPLEKPLYLYAGLPARPIRELPPDLGYFHRARGPVY
jgi:serine acetyltransferase